MISLPELMLALVGSWKLIRLEEKALDFFDLSERGFWKSFTAAALLIAAQCLVLLWVASPQKEPVHIVLREVASGTMLWLSYPLIAHYVLIYLGCRERYFSYIVPFNWLQLPFGLAFLATSLLVLMNMKFVLLFYVLIGVWIFYHARLIRLSLNVAPNMAFALALFEFFLGLVLQAVAVAVSAGFVGA